MKGNRQRRWDKKAILVRQVKALVEATTDVMMENGVGVAFALETGRASP